MEKVRPWCGQPSDRGRLRNRTEQATSHQRIKRKYSYHWFLRNRLSLQVQQLIQVWIRSPAAKVWNLCSTFYGPDASCVAQTIFVRKNAERILDKHHGRRSALKQRFKNKQFWFKEQHNHSYRCTVKTTHLPTIDHGADDVYTRVYVWLRSG